MGTDETIPVVGNAKIVRGELHSISLRDASAVDKIEKVEASRFNQNQ
jgi:hypothetical protein